jgi:hypothetical protein
VFVSTVVAYSIGEAVVVDVVVAETLALRVHVLAGEGFYCYFLFNLLLHDLRPFCHHLSPG